MTTPNNQEKRFNPVLYQRNLRPSKGRIILGGLIDFILLVAFFVVGFSTIIRAELFQTFQIAGITLLTISTYLILIKGVFIKIGWVSFGYFLTGLILVDGYTGKRLYAGEIIGLWAKRMLYQFKYAGFYEMYNFFESSSNQTKVMEELHIFTVDYKRYQKMIKKGDLVVS